jgi:hypothetical protein
MFAASEIVQLVDKVAVLPARVKVQQQLRGRNGQHDRAGAGQPLQ